MHWHIASKYIPEQIPLEELPFKVDVTVRQFDAGTSGLCRVIGKVRASVRTARLSGVVKENGGATPTLEDGRWVVFVTLGGKSYVLSFLRSDSRWSLDTTVTLSSDEKIPAAPQIDPDWAS